MIGPETPRDGGLGVGRETRVGASAQERPEAAQYDEDVSIEARRLSKSYGPVLAVDDVSFAVRRGEILGLLGPNGAGKSTTLRMLIGFQYPDSGEVRLLGRDVYRQGAEARAELGYMPEALPLYAEMPVRAYLRHFAELKGITDLSSAIDRVTGELALEDVIERPCGNLSRGYRQRVGLAQALLANPSVLVLDEPTSGLDPNQIHDFRGLIRELGKDRSVLLSTHILPEALEICDRLVILSRGRVVAEGRPHEIAGAESGLHWVRLRAAQPPAPELQRRFGLEREGTEGAVYCVRQDLDATEARALLGVITEQGWDLLEWQTGSAGLEAVFRRLTLGQE